MGVDMTKMPEPIELSSPMDERAIYGHTADQLKQYGRDLLESAAVEMQGLYTYGGDDVAAVIRAMKEQIK
jgi:hypothetical protein